MYMAYTQNNQSRTPHRSASVSEVITTIKQRHTKAMIRLVIIVMILGTVFSFGAMVQAYAASTTSPTASVPVHTVSKAEVHQKIVIQAGDTLWAIAEANKHSKENVRSYIDKIKSLNHLATSSLNEGQVLLLP